MNIKRTFAWSVDQHLDHDVAVRVFDAVRQRYLEASRHYPNWEHVTTMLETFVSLPRDLMDHPQDVIAAIVFHDAIYDPRRSDNEEASAALASQELAGLPENRRRRISDLILATDHKRPAKTSDEALICDVDLAILGAAPSRYDDYVAAVRAEYDFVPEDAWNTGRAKVLNSFLERERMFQTPPFQDLNLRARDNLERELRGLINTRQVSCN